MVSLRSGLLSVQVGFRLDVAEPDGGFGGAVCEVAAETGSGCRVKRIGLEDCFTTVVGDRQYLRETYGMDGKAIAEKAEAFLNE